MKYVLGFLAILCPAILYGNDWALIVEQKPVSAWALTCEPVNQDDAQAQAHALIRSIPRTRRALLFTATWCGPCNQMKRDTLPPLRERGWLVGDQSSDHIQVIDADEFPGLVKLWNVTRFPTMIYLENESEANRAVGVQSPHDVGRLFDRAVQSATAQKSSSYQARWTFPGNGREDLIAHLASENHNYTIESLRSMTTDQLFQLHDSDHDKGVRQTRRRFSLPFISFGEN